MKRKINCETARAFPIEKALAKLGHFPIKTAEKEAWFLSPFRSETQASFKVSKIKNQWYDHGAGVGGNVIDLVCRILKCSVKEALEFINDDRACFSFHQQSHFSKNETGISITKIQDISHPALIQYLNFRAIPLQIANSYCSEVWYTFKGKQFFAIGLQNNNNGWELRNKIFKNSSSPKSYTYLQRNSKHLIILEGMFDLLSLAVLNALLIEVSDVMVLNSIAFIKNVEKHISNYEIVDLYLDNDSAGQNATLYLTKKYSHVNDQSDAYKNHKDLNEFLCHERKE
ncbi:CHC2-type zinc finger protein [Gelidibacter algens]|uniref:CHC2-type zinc finger protein n=1 Tax=Gelidibacter algens TaxID=49280 RepID=A0A327RZA9_9FLAO|nr:toprim domain-containing protein [Gelidibacter algens]RAJ21124.1 CHC2-type zinc finger protein [Gelidibacter algens]